MIEAARKKMNNPRKDVLVKPLASKDSIDENIFLVKYIYTVIKYVWPSFEY